MILRSVINAEEPVSGLGEYHLGFFACGFESRCSALMSRVRRDEFERLFVIGFSENSHSSARETAEAYFRSLDPDEFLICSANDYSFITKCMGSWGMQDAQDLRILVDYSSMSRIWYGAILNYFRASERDHRVIIDFCYVPGSHNADKPALEVQGIATIPGFEGISNGSARATAVFSLGFEKWSPYAALERVQPDDVICIIAEPGAIPEYAGVARSINTEFFQEYNTKPIEIDIRDVAGAFGFLSSTTSAKLHQSCDVALVGMGSKPHTLAMLLAGVRFPEAAVVHVRKTGVGTQDVAPLNTQIITRVVFENA